VIRSGDIEKNPGPNGRSSRVKKFSVDEKKKLKIIHLNIQSILRHLDNLQSLVNSKHPDIIALSEKWLNVSISDAYKSV
jgi:hypothetical protein